MRSHESLAVLVAFLSLHVGCTPAPLARVPELPRNGDAAARVEAYDRYHLEPRGDAVHRKDGDYPWPQTQTLAETYPASADAYHSAQARVTGLAIMAGVGAGIVSFTGVYSVTADSNKQMSTGAKVGLYSGGAALVIVALLIAATSPSPTEDIVKGYNEGLRKDLGIPETKPAVPPPPAAYLEHTFAF